MMQVAQAGRTGPQAATAAPSIPASLAGRPGAGSQAPGGNPFDEVQRLAQAGTVAPQQAPAPGGGLHLEGKLPGDQSAVAGTSGAARAKAAATAAAATANAAKAPRGTVPCTLDAITVLSPERFADFLADTYTVSVDGCLRGLLWTWDPRLIPVMSRAHVQAVAKRIALLAPKHRGTNANNLYEMFTYLHAVAYHDFSHDEIDTTDAPTVAAVQRAVAAFGTAPRTFDATKANANTLREALYAASAPGLRRYQLPLIKKVLATMAPGAATATDADWGGAVLAALSVNYLGIYPGNNDTAFRAAAGSDTSYRNAFRVFAGYGHLKGTANAWAARDAVGEYGRFGQIDALRTAIINDLGTLLGTTEAAFGKMSAPWAGIASWLNYYGDCQRFNVCKSQIEAALFPNTFTYDNGAIEVRTGLDRGTVDQLYYASKQVKTQFFRVLGTSAPLAGDTNTTLHIHLYASRADYEVYQPLLTGYSTANGGMYIEGGATFYTYQRRVPQDSSLTLEELFRHEYTHYLNGRWAVPGTFGDARWFANDLTTAMDEGTAEFFDGGTRDDGIKVRKSLVQSIINDTAGGGPRMSVNQLLHATYAGDGFRFYSYAGTFFEFLWTEHPTLVREMYGYQRADDPAGFDAWRSRTGADASLQREYDAFLDQQIAQVTTLYVPDTHYTPNGSLTFATAAEVGTAFAAATSNTPVCKDNADWNNKVRFTCTGRITANLADSADPDQVFKDMSETVDYFILDRAGAAANNLADMNCTFGAVDVWSSGLAGTSDYSCEGPLRR
ncbi:collagenase [Streptomyces sp. H10-C2]|uniref:collagenase n=1 Tax=unclassified Streptomyces TaxID=2593676 RepID=UPI0024B9ACDE|nr:MULTISPECIES: collagenase [unclassified Streptomyces]MDJ0344693.1 collagenase [Streptomyces sp. PH10-H1]MDJ0372823.1 collagenase [Streptomyces sp. H10-C2]